MRGLRSFLALLAILVALGAYLYFVESERTPGQDDDREKVFSVEADAIEEVAITSDSGEQTTARKSGDTWQIVEPITASADSSELSGLTSSLASLEIQRVIDEQATDLEQYGLAKPRFQIGFKSGGQDQRLLVGLKTPPGSDIYARKNDESKVFLIAAHLETTFNRGTFDLRDKTVMRIDRESLNAIEIEREGRTLKLARADGEWSLTEPVASPADYSEVNGLVTQITAAQMRSIEDTPKPDLNAYGLVKPAATIRVGTGDAAVVLLLGGKAEDETAIHAKLDGRPEIFTVDAALLDAVSKDPSEFRQKDLFNARAFNTGRIEVTRGAEVAAFEKQRTTTPDGKEEEEWRKVAPAEAEVDGAKVDSLIFAATGARAESFVTDGTGKPPATPEMVIAIRFDEGKREERVTFWRSGDSAFASRADVPGVARIGVTTLDDIVKAFEDLK